MRKTTSTAEKQKKLLIELSPVIEAYTAAVCPGCRDVCCKQRHGVMNEEDLRYCAALGTPPPAYDPGRMQDGPCQFMGASGCIHPRWLRPWRCTAYFCDALLAAMNSGPPKTVRHISSLIQEIVDLRNGWKTP